MVDVVVNLPHKGNSKTAWILEFSPLPYQI
jgi:hypothetical protein